MKVHLIKTPEYNNEDFRKVSDFLNSFDGVLKFIPSADKFSPGDFEFPDSYFKNAEGVKNLSYEVTMQPALSWEQLLSICKYYRILCKIDSQDFVVLLTSKNNILNWFSYFDSERNIFIHTANWESLINVHHKYPVAYQVVENILQSLMNMPFDIFFRDYVHQKPRGCMNDFCGDKEEIKLKFQTSNICTDCAKKIQEENVDTKIINQALKIFEKVRDELLFKNRLSEQIVPVPIIINQKNQILLPKLNLEIDLNPLYKTLYIFYLRHTEGLRLNDLRGFEEELRSLYKKLSVADNNTIIDTRIDDLVNPMEGSFSQKKSKINKIITNSLGEHLAKFYRIEGKPGEPFKINLPKNLIEFRG